MGMVAAVTKQKNRELIYFAWQSWLHNLIFRDGRSIDNISNYIRNNPKNWKKDRF